MSFDFSTLVTDRSQADLDTLRALLSVPLADWTAEQLAEFNQAISKGSYNYTDLNRVTACMDYLNEVLTGLGYETGYQRIVVPHQGEPSPVGPLPYGYTELEYIKSTETQYINTGFTPNQDTRVLVDIIFPGTTVATSKAVFGSRQTITSKSFTFYSYNGHYSTTYNTVDNQCYPELIETRFLVDKDKNEITVNGTLYEQSYGVFSGQGPLYLFAINNNGSVFAQGEVFLYSCKIYDNETLVRDFVPCKNPDLAIGLYDLIGKTFYGNSGSGAFTAGPEVPSPEPQPDPYTWYEEDTPTATQMARYLQNVAALRGVLELPEDAAQVPADMVGLTLTEANNIEQLLEEINDYFTALQAVFLRSGMAWVVSGGPEFYFSN